MKGEEKALSAAKLYVILMFLANVALGTFAALFFFESRECAETLSLENSYHDRMKQKITDPKNRAFFGAYRVGKEEDLQRLEQFVFRQAKLIGVDRYITSRMPPTFDRKTSENLVKVRVEKIPWKELLRFMHTVEQPGRKVYARELRTQRIERTEDGTAFLSASITFAETASQ